MLKTCQTKEEDIYEQVAFEKHLKKYDNAIQLKVVDIKAKYGTISLYGRMMTAMKTSLD